MALGPEFICGLATAFSEKLAMTSGGARITRVEGGESWVALKVTGFDGGEWLLLSWGSGSAGCCFASSEAIVALSSGAPARTPLVEALKSRAVRGDLIAVRQLNHDRVLELTLRRRIAAGTSIGYFLVLEATEPIGNFLLLNEEHVIEEVAHHAAPDQNPYRTLLPGHKYVTPPAFNGLSLDDFAALVAEGDGDAAAEAVMNLTGIGRPLARWLVSHWTARTPDEWLSFLRSALDNKPAESVSSCFNFILGKNYLTRLGLDLALFSGSGSSVKSLGTDAIAAASHGVLAPMLERSRERRLHAVEVHLKRAVKSKERHRDGLRKQLKDCATAEVYRRKGELLLAHLHEIPARAETVTLTDWTALAEGAEISEMTIELDVKLSPSKNAERYFKKYRKASGDVTAIQAKLDSVEGAISEILEQRDLLESISVLDGPDKFEEAVRDVESWLEDSGQGSATGGKGKKGNRAGHGGKSGKGREVLPPHLVFDFEAEGLVVLVGLSARGNRYVTFKQAHGGDIWLHAHELPGSHVIIRSIQGRSGDLRAELETEYREILEFAAAMAAGHSKGRNSALVSVDYTERRHVRAVPGTVALVTYTEPGTLRVKPVTSE